MRLALPCSPAEAGVQSRREAANALPRAMYFKGWTPAFAGEQGMLS